MVPIPKPLVIMPGNKPRFRKLRTNNENENYGKTQVHHEFLSLGFLGHDKGQLVSE